MWASVCLTEGMASTKALARSCQSLVICLKVISEYVMGLDNNFFQLLLVVVSTRKELAPSSTLGVPAKHLQFTHTHTDSYPSPNVNGKGDRT